MELINEKNNPKILLNDNKIFFSQDLNSRIVDEVKRINEFNQNLPFTERNRHYSEIENDTLIDSKLVEKKNNLNLNNSFFDSEFSDYSLDLSKLGSSAPNTSWITYDKSFKNKSPIVLLNDRKNHNDVKFSSYLIKKNHDKIDLNSRLDMSKKQNNFLQVSDFTNNEDNLNFKISKEDKIFLSTGSIETVPNTIKSNKNLIRNRKRCYSMGDSNKDHLKKTSKLLTSFTNLAFNQNFLEVLEPNSTSKTFENNEEDDDLKLLTNNDVLELNNNKILSNINLNNSNQNKIQNSDFNFENNNSLKRKFSLDKNENFLLINSNHGLLHPNQDDLDIEDKKSFTCSIEFSNKLACDLFKPEIETESLLSFLFQVLFPLLISGIGNLIAGLALHRIKDFEVFKIISELFIAIPCLMGLKGNLEMTMASRLSTASNLGVFEHLPQILSLSKSNICLLQFQATIISLLASIFSIISLIQKESSFDKILILVSSNILTANIACTFLSTLMIGIILFCKHKKINPDNIATPIASSLGDVITIFLLSFISSILFTNLKTGDLFLNYFSLSVIFFLCPISFCIAFKNQNTQKILKTGWLPIIISMIISSFAGLILDKVIRIYTGFDYLQPIINSVGGNLAAIQASRISTYLFKTCKFGQLPVKELTPSDIEHIENTILHNLNTNPICLNQETKIQIESNLFENKSNENTNFLFNTSKQPQLISKKFKNYFNIIFSSGSINKRCTRLLAIIAIPMHVLYFYLIKLVENDGAFDDYNLFVFYYLFVAVIQVLILLHLAKFFVYQLWKHRLDPDNWAIPLLTAIGDFIGTSLLAIAFFVINL